MKTFLLITMITCLLSLAFSIQVPAHTEAQSKTAIINGRLFFPNDANFIAPCKAIKVSALPKNGTPVVQYASGPLQGAHSGGCTFSLKNVPANVPIELTAVIEGSGFGNWISGPEETYPAPAGKWTNPLTLKPGQTVMKYLRFTIKS